MRAGAKRAIAAYLNVPVYAQFHDWLGRGDVLRPMWEAWQAGDRKQALAEIPDSLVDELIVHGSPEACRARDPAVLRQRRDDHLAGDHAPRPEARLLVGGARRGAQRRLRNARRRRITPPCAARRDGVAPIVAS